MHLEFGSVSFRFGGVLVTLVFFSCNNLVMVPLIQLLSEYSSTLQLPFSKCACRPCFPVPVFGFCVQGADPMDQLTAPQPHGSWGSCRFCRELRRKKTSLQGSIFCCLSLRELQHQLLQLVLMKSSRHNAINTLLTLLCRFAPRIFWRFASPATLRSSWNLTNQRPAETWFDFCTLNRKVFNDQTFDKVAV